MQLQNNLETLDYSESKVANSYWLFIETKKWAWYELLIDTELALYDYKSYFIDI